MRQEIETKLKRIFSIDDDLARLGLGSVSFVKIIVAVESEFDFEFADEDLDFKNFKTLNNVVSYIEGRIKG